SGVTVGAASGASSSAGAVTFSVKSSTGGNFVFTATDATDSVTIQQTATVTFGTPSVVVRIDPAAKRLPPGGNGSVGVVADLTGSSTSLGAWTIDVAYSADLATPTACTTNLTGAAAVCN